MIGQVTSAADLEQLFLLIEKPPADIENQEVPQKPRLFLNTATGDMGWVTKSTPKELNITTQFNIVLSAIAGKIDNAFTQVKIVSNAETKTRLEDLRTRAQQSLARRIECYQLRNSGWFNCYYRRFIKGSVDLLSSHIGTKMTALATLITGLTCAPPPPAFKPSGKKAPAATQVEQQQGAAPPAKTKPPTAKGQPAVSLTEITSVKLKKPGARGVE